MKVNIPSIHAIILAAGSSSRMSPQIKQLYRHPKAKIPLLEHCLNEITRLPNLASKTLILGAHFDQILKNICFSKSIEVKVNPLHEFGLGSSISCGLKTIQDAFQLSDSSAVLLILADQPEVTTDFLNCLIQYHNGEDPNAITVSQYENGAKGPPVIFGSAHFEALMQLRGELGAKHIMQRHAEDVSTYLDPSFSGYDLDTDEDLRRFESENA